MLDLTRDSESLASFEKNPKDYLDQVRKTGKPLILTIKGRAALVLQDAASFQRLVRVAEKNTDLDFLRESIADVDNGRTVPLREAILAMGKK